MRILGISALASFFAVAAFAAPMEIIDAHVHTSYSGKLDEETGIIYSREGLLQHFEDSNVVGAISMMSRFGTGYDPELASKHHVKFCVGVSMNPDYAGIEAGLKSGQYGCIKIYLGYVPRYAYDLVYNPVYDLAEKYKVPVVFHTGDVYDVDAPVKYADPLTIDEVAIAHRKVTMVIAHCGNPWIQSAAEVAYKNANVYLDGSAILIGDLTRFNRKQLKEQLVQPLKWVFNYIENPKKLMFGTDWPLVPIDQYLEVFLEAIPPQHWAKVFHDNAVRVFKMDLPLLEQEEKPYSSMD